jgi:PHD/YefM family antitoxin component YafN of YafNO toxin-antitoxin module
MLSITAAEFHRNFGRYQDEVLRHSLSITRKGRDGLVVMSLDEYQRLKRRDRAACRTEDLSDDELEAIANTEMDPRHNHLDAELT